MGWEDRPYYRDRGGTAGNPLTWLLTGSVPLFTAFGIRVRAHSSLVIIIVLMLLFGLGPGFRWQDQVLASTMLFAIVLVHEFGHCFTARWVGGEAEDILMSPLGGLAFARPPHRPLPTFLTVAGGPAVNVVICIICGVLVKLTYGFVPWNPLDVHRPGPFYDWVDVGRYAYWIYLISWSLLLFNLWPVYPLDGGQMLQAALWPKFGYYRSMKFSTITGMIGSVVMAMVGLASGAWLLLFIGISCFLTCYNRWQVLKSEGPGAFEEGYAYSAGSYTSENRTRRRSNAKAEKQLRKLREEAVAEQQQIDQILAKVSAQGMHSLTWREKRALRQATEAQRRRDVEMQRRRR